MESYMEIAGDVFSYMEIRSPATFFDPPLVQK